MFEISEVLLSGAFSDRLSILQVLSTESLHPSSINKHLRNILRVHGAELRIPAKRTVTTWYSTTLDFPPPTRIASLWLTHFPRPPQDSVDILVIAFRIGIVPGLRRSRSSTTLHDPLFLGDAALEGVSSNLFRPGLDVTSSFVISEESWKLELWKMLHGV